jgi:hypothetical protein
MKAVVVKPAANTNRPGRSLNESGEGTTLRRRICYLLSLLRIHSPDCEHCNARETSGDEIRKRLEELCWRTQQRSLELAPKSRGVRRTKRRNKNASRI